MAGPPYQITAFFRDDDGQGWSEKYFTSVNMTPTQADGFAAAFVPARMAMATTRVFMNHIRIGSAVGRAPFAYFPTIGGGALGALGVASLPSDMGLLMQLISVNRYYNKVFLRGIPQACVEQEDRVAFAPFDNAAVAFRSFLLGTGFIVIRTVLGTAAPPVQVVSVAAGSPKGIRLIQLATTPALTIGQTIRLHGASIPGYNGPKTVVQGPIDVPTGKLYLLGGANPISDPPTADQIYYTVPTVSMPALSDVQFEHVTERKTGRPFGEPRGRARTLFSLRP